MSEMSSVRVPARTASREPLVLPWWVPLVTGIAWLVYGLIVLSASPATVSSVALFFALACFGFSGLEVLNAAATHGWRRWAHAGMAFLALAAGVLAFAYPGRTFVILAWLAGWLILARGVFDLSVALANRDVELWWVGLIAGIAEIGIAFWAIGHWGNLAVLLVVWIGLWTLVRGIADIFAAFQARAGAEGPPGLPA